MKTLKTRYLLLSLACSAPALLSCSMPLQQTDSALRIEPLLRIRNSDSSARGFYQLGRYYQGQNRHAQAGEAYRSALLQDPDYIDAHSALGTIYSMQGQSEAAIAEFSQILKTAPQLAYIHNNLGYAHYLQGNHAAAVKAFEQAIALEPQNLRARNNLGLALQGDAEKSRPAVGQAAETPAAIGIGNGTGAGSLTALAAGSAPAPVNRESVQLPPLSATSVSLQSSAPAVSLAAIPAAASPLAPVANDNGVAGYARSIGDRLAQNGLPTPQPGKLNSYRQRRTVLQYQYRDGGFHDESLRLSRMLQAQPVMLSDSSLRAGADLRLILGIKAARNGVLLRQYGDGVLLADSGGKNRGVALQLTRKLGGHASQFL